MLRKVQSKVPQKKFRLRRFRVGSSSTLKTPQRNVQALLLIRGMVLSRKVCLRVPLLPCRVHRLALLVMPQDGVLQMLLRNQPPAKIKLSLKPKPQPLSRVRKPNRSCLEISRTR